MKVHKLNASYEDAKVVIHSHNIQQDTHSCGPLSIMAAQQYMKNEFQEFREAPTDCNAIRIAIGNMLLRHCDEENLDEFCVHCSKTTSRSTAWYACDQCCRWIHESCSAEPAENEQFLCKHCTI
ncbi:unnamed protein product [Clavelina lepadiformis]|uniref:Zinc finger PHD-type domain-containing protein n=1 Tax=Clavelina lepadiformis TaxID=159417 RepID=A0ABP0GHT3_CLALP